MVVAGYGAEAERAGGRVLNLLAASLTAPILEELGRGSRRLVELRRETGSPRQTTLRARMCELTDVGAVAKRRLHPFPSVREHVLTNGAGTELRFVAATLAAWLAQAPGGALELGGESARATVNALVDGWSAGILRVLAERAATIAELDAALDGLSTPALERRVAALLEAGLVTTRSDPAGESLFESTEWLRMAAAPIVTAIRWERKHVPTITPSPAPVDAEAGFLLAVPLLRLPEEASGRCRLEVEFGDGAERHLAGVTLEVERGEVVSCGPKLDCDPTAAATGPPSAWQRVTIESHPDRLQLAGDTRLARAVLDGFNRTLFPPRLI